MGETPENMDSGELKFPPYNNDDLDSIGITQGNGFFWRMNDFYEFTFPEIAQVIRKEYNR
jgi:hypothetical protein